MVGSCTISHNSGDVGGVGTGLVSLLVEMGSKVVMEAGRHDCSGAPRKTFVGVRLRTYAQFCSSFHYTGFDY